MAGCPPGHVRLCRLLDQLQLNRELVLGVAVGLGGLAESTRPWDVNVRWLWPGHVDGRGSVWLAEFPKLGRGHSGWDSFLSARAALYF